MKMALWSTETFEDELGFTLKVKQTLHGEKTQYRHIDILEMDLFEKMLLLDGAVSLKLNTTIERVIEAPSPCTILLRNGTNETPFHRNQLYLSECLL